MKKQIIIISFLFTIISAQATVQPVHPGENLWQIVSRIGATLDDIEDCICNGIVPPPVDVCPDCDTFIKQSDIPFTITAPGVYCLQEDITLKAGQTGIEIKSECVELDLCGHIIDGKERLLTEGIHVVGTDIGIQPANVTIKNGTIKVMRVSGSKGIGVFIDEVTGPVMLSNLIITQCDRGVLINEGSKGITLDHCVCSENDRVGFFVTGGGRQCVFQDCIARKNGEEGFMIEGAGDEEGDEEGDEDCCFINCKGFENGGVANFYMKFASHNVFVDCVATGAKGVVECNVKADETGDGFRVDGKEAAGGRTRDNIFFHCTATNNTEDGFQIHDATYNVIRDCVANNNDSIGINLGTGLQAVNNQVIGCDCVGNGDFGINDTPKKSFIVNNLAHDNKGAGPDYDGVTAGTIKPWNTVDTDTGYWANVGNV